MTFEIPTQRLPRLKMKAGLWWCSDSVTCAPGVTQKMAYANWKSQRNLIDRMHRNEVHRNEVHQNHRGLGEERHGGFYGEHGST